MKHHHPVRLLIEDERAAYAARYHGVAPEGYELRNIILREYGGACVCCGLEDPDQLTLDHIEPRRGGTRRRYIVLWRSGFPKDNLQVMCFPCNQAKGTGTHCPHMIVAYHAAFYVLLMLGGQQVVLNGVR